MFESGRCLFWGALTFGVASVAYILYGPSPASKKKCAKNSVKNPKGLVNAGNQCFINAVLQSLAACKSLMTWLQYSQNNTSSNGYFPRQSNYRVTASRLSEPNNQVTTCLLKTLRTLNNVDNAFEESSPSEVLDALLHHNWRIPNEEQDAHELFNVLTQTLESELYSSLPMYSLKDALLVEDLIQSPISSAGSSPGITTRGSQSVASSRTPKSLPTRGLLASQLQCKVCNYKYPVHLDIFDTISLVIPNKVLGGPILLQDCLNKFVSNEIIHEVVCEECSDSGRKASFVKKLTFGKLPSLLCFHIQRLVWLTNGHLMKRTEHVNFPEYLNMDDYVYASKKTKGKSGEDCSSALTGLMGGTSSMDRFDKRFPLEQLRQQNEPPAAAAGGDLSLLYGTPNNSARARYRYRLCSTIVHLGDAFSGHFITYRRGGSPDDDTKWYYASDMNVRQVSLREVLSSPAYMLFYERIKQ